MLRQLAAVPSDNRLFSCGITAPVWYEYYYNKNACQPASLLEAGCDPERPNRKGQSNHGKSAF